VELVVLAFGGITAVMGVLYALMQHDLKRLLAYHTVENIGIIFIGLENSKSTLLTTSSTISSGTVYASSPRPGTLMCY
jgi:formate hydrogenlyase subunit 3/multisubunit Na+/H+ antiporter MnhD subunit